ncbi:MAG: MBL fold metallo-hydrolase [archaeon]
MINQIKPNIWQFVFSDFGSCVYILKIKDKLIAIDTSSSQNLGELILFLEKINLSPKDIDILILTHKHYDHDDNIDIFEKAKLYGSKEDFSDEKILDIFKLNIPEFEIIETPGHTKGSICLFLEKEKILFSGDTIFHNGYIGRTDLPTSVPEKMNDSLEKLKKINYKILCPGHMY